MKKLREILKKLATDPLMTTDAIYDAVDTAEVEIRALFTEKPEKEWCSCEEPNFKSGVCLKCKNPIRFSPLPIPSKNPPKIK